MAGIDTSDRVVDTWIMRLFVLPVFAGLGMWALPAEAQPAPSWHDVPALVAAATAPHAAELRGCIESGSSREITLSASRIHDATRVAMPLPAVGGRGLTPEERCLGTAVAKIALPELPAEIESVLLGYTILTANATAAPTEKAFDDWRDPAATIGTLIDAKQRRALAACDAKPRTVRFVVDLRSGATRVWLPAWQFHSDTGDGTTPPAQRQVKSCLTHVIENWHAPKLPQAMGELQLAISVTPAS